MSSYLRIYLVKKDALDFYNKQTEIKNQNEEQKRKSFFEKDELLENFYKDSIVLFDYSRSTALYRIFKEVLGFSYSPVVLKENDLNEVYSYSKKTLNEEELTLKKYLDKTLIYEKDSPYGKAISYLNNLKSTDKNAESEIQNILDIVYEAQESSNFEFIQEIIQELTESVEELKFAIGIIQSLFVILDNNEYLNKDYIVCYDFD